MPRKAVLLIKSNIRDAVWHTDTSVYVDKNVPEGKIERETQRQKLGHEKYWIENIVGLLVCAFKLRYAHCTLLQKVQIFSE